MHAGVGRLTGKARGARVVAAAVRRTDDATAAVGRGHAVGAHEGGVEGGRQQLEEAVDVGVAAHVEAVMLPGGRENGHEGRLRHCAGNLHTGTCLSLSDGGKRYAVKVHRGGGVGGKQLSCS